MPFQDIKVLKIFMKIEVFFIAIETAVIINTECFVLGVDVFFFKSYGMSIACAILLPCVCLCAPWPAFRLCQSSAEHAI